MSKTISLNMIVKNESHIIKKTLEHLTSIFNFSYWVICDTGSTDNTQNIIIDFFEKKNIKGELLQHEWKGFGYNRSMALEAVYEKSDYTFIFDADDWIHGEFVLPELKDDMYHLKIGNNFVYKRPLLINNHLKWKFVGVLHEYLSCIDNYKTETTINGDYYIESGKSGSRSLDINKYINDAEILERAYENEDDVSLKARYAFYCAQSYMDANNNIKSIKWYKIVLTSVNWSQEKYYACLSIAKQLKYLNGDMKDIIHYLTLAGTFDNERIEHITNLCEYLYGKNMHILVNAIYLQKKYKHKTIQNPNDKLFLSVDDNSIEYFNSISSYYIGDYDSGYECCKKILLSIFNVQTGSSDLTNYNEIIKDNINNNYRFISTINNLCFYKDALKNDNNGEDIEKLFLLVDYYIKSRHEDNNIYSIFELWNIIFNKMNFSNYKLYNHKNKELPIVFLSMTTCKRIDLFQKTINSIFNCWNDVDKIDYWFCVDDNSSEADRDSMIEKYPFFEYYFKNENEKGHRTSMNIIWNKLNSIKPKYWIHIEDDFLFFDKMDYVSESIFGLEFLSEYNVKQILFNKSYAETIEDYKITGATIKGNYCIHEHSKDGDNTHINNKYWPHYSFRPSLVSVDAILELGDFNTPNQFFELDYANKWNDKGYKSAFFNKITNKHIGRLTKDRNNSIMPNAYELNLESQFSKETNYIKVVNLLRRADRKENCVELFKKHNVNNHEFIEAVDGKDIKEEDTEYLYLFKGNDFGSRRGFIGCALSHYKLWKQLINDNENEFYLILEDDIRLSDNFTEMVYKLKPIMKQKEFLFMGYHMYNKERENVENIYDVINNNIKVVNLNNNLFIGGTYCYSVNKKGAKYMLDFIDKHGIKHGIDYIIGKLNNNICYELQPHICFSEWHEDFKPIDTDIQMDCEAIDIDNYYKIKEDIFSQFIFIEGKDQVEFDLYYKQTTLLEAMKIALNDNNCVGFNTLGFFKNKIKNLTSSAYYKASDGMYIKKNEYERFINEENCEENASDAIVNIKKKIKIKLMCHWCSSEQLCKEWSNMFETKNSWKDIEITHENNVDYFVIINCPYKDEYFERSRSIVFQMEPWVHDKSKDWGVKTWKEWAEPDENNFLYVCTHKKMLNGVQWQINIPKSIHVNRYNKIISVLSAKNYDNGHIKRINFVKYMEKENQNKIDIFGHKNHHSFKNYKGQLNGDKKENHYVDYKYCLAVENNMEFNYATEKIWESILCECLTFYWGCPNLETYIDSNAFVRLDLYNFQESMNIINKAIKEDWWSQRIDIIRREKLKIINELGFFPNLRKLIDDIKVK